ncbi:MAG: hypothetical protein ABW051_07070 [Burkholderiaceae bacterium]
MALFKKGTNVRAGSGDAFERTLNVLDAAPWTGIYACVACGDEAAVSKDAPMPGAEGHAPHGEEWGEIRWRLLVFASRKLAP